MTRAKSNEVLGNHRRQSQQSRLELRLHVSVGLQTHTGDGKRFIVRADEKLTAFLELEAASRAARLWFHANPSRF